MDVQSPNIEQDALEDLTGQSIGLVDRAEFTAVKFRHCEMAHQDAEDVLFDQVVGTHTDISQVSLQLAQVLDSRFHTCDFANTTFEKAYLRRVQFLGCRLLGVVFQYADVQDVVVHRCQGDMCRFTDSTFKAVRFEHTSLRQASFANSKLAGVVFRHCDLSQADFRGASLRGADLRSSILDGIQVGTRELQGVIIDSGQAVQIARLFGVVVKDEADEVMVFPPGDCGGV